jgi:hypothetical protein
VPTVGGSRFNPFDKTIATGPQDIAGLLARPDVLGYATGPLTEEVSINGASEVHVYFVCDRPDADISVRLCDVYPDGKWVILTQGIQRLRLRNSLSAEQLLTPGKPDSATVGLSNLAMTFLKGHRIGLVISGSNFPMFDINPNSGGKLYTAGDTLTAETRVSLSAGSPTKFTFKTGSIISGAENDGEGGAMSFEIFPNPAAGEMYLSFGTPQGNVLITLADMLGNTVFTKKYDGEITGCAIPTEQLPAGIYTLRAQTSAGVWAELLQILR